MMLDIRQIESILPHRSPFLLIDRIIAVEAGVKAIGLKNVTINEPYFVGHFPGYPVMPGVLIAEALAQVGAVALLADEKYAGKLPMFAGIDNFKFRRPVYPGDVLHLETRLLWVRRGMGKGIGEARIGEELAASGEISFALVDKPVGHQK